ncbi:isoaspartyl peptidase/L-asparaginase [Candidatus Hodarchaeum mangrovi]
MKFGVIIHGGAWDIPDNAVTDHLNGVQKACNIANKLLKNGKSSLDAVEAAISVMENDSTFDAGKGSFVNQIGEVEMDAIIATEGYQFGAVCAVQNISNPIKLARLVMEKTKQHILVGKGANLFAEQMGLPFVAPESLLVGRELDRYYKIKRIPNFSAKNMFRDSRRKINGMGTVGAICLDILGKISVGVSTGGTPHKRSGRVGDTPLWGAGGYVESSVGAAATGYGEDIIKVLLTYKAVEYAKIEPSLNKAATRAITELKRVNGLGGVIMLNQNDVGFDFNTPRMAFAYQIEDTGFIVGIDPGDAKRERKDY